MSPPKVLIRSKKRLRDGFVGLDQVAYSYADQSASAGSFAVELVDRPDVAATLVYAPDAGAVVLTRQFRAAARLREGVEAAGWPLEIAAGAIEPGEAPAEAARREVVEEIGCTLASLDFVAAAFLSPGVSMERAYIFCGVVDGPLDDIAAADEGGIDEERILIEHVPIDAFERMVRAGDLVDAKTIIAAQWFFANGGGRRDEA